MHLRVKDFLQLDLPKFVKGKTRSGRLIDLNIGRWLHDNASDLIYSDKSIISDAVHLPGLELTLEATASDALINRRIYTGISVRKRHSTFRGKPIGKNHDDLTDPVGRITFSKFEQFLSGTDFENAYLTPAIQKDGKIKGQPSGRVVVKARIMDADTIEKIQDGRLATVSQEGRASAVRCSICQQDWLQDGFCEHRPGSMCDVEDKQGKPTGKKKLAFLVVDMEVFDGLDFVKTPAWSEAMVLEIGDMDSVSQQDQMAIELNRKIQDEIIPDLPQEQLVCRARDVILYDALGEPTILVEDGKPIMADKIIINRPHKITESLDSNATKTISDTKENKDMELEKKNEELTDKNVNLEKQVNVLTDNLEKTAADAKKLEEDNKSLESDRDGLRNALQKANVTIVKRDAEEIVRMQCTLGKIKFDDDAAKEKYLDDMLSKDSSYLLGILDTLRPEFEMTLKDMSESNAVANLAANPGALSNTGRTTDSPNIAPAPVKDKQDLLS